LCPEGFAVDVVVVDIVVAVVVAEVEKLRYSIASNTYVVKKGPEHGKIDFD